MFNHTPTSLGYDDLEVLTETGGRRYQTPDGVWYPSITTILDKLPKPEVDSWRLQVGDVEADATIKRSGIRGGLFHDAIERYLKNDPDLNLMPHIKMSLKRVKPVLSRIGDIYGLETALYSNLLKVAGRCDCVAEFDGKVSILDWKTAKKMKTLEMIHGYMIQCCAYAIMWQERTGMVVETLVVIMDGDDSPRPEVFVQSPMDWVPHLQEAILNYHRTVA